MKKLKIVFMGTPDFAVPVLKALYENNHEVCSVYCQPPRPSGRGQKETPSPVEATAKTLGLCVRHPVSLKSEEEQQSFVNLKADVAVVAAYGLMLPKSVLEAFPYGCINVHASLLPRWRGAAPIQRAIIAGDKETGISIMRLVQKMDAGAVLLQEKIAIEPNDTSSTLYDKLAKIGAPTLLKALDLIKSGQAVFKEQDETLVTHAAKILKEEGNLDFSLNAVDLERKIRGLNPFPKAWFSFEKEQIKVNLATVVSGKHSFETGTVVDDNLTIACGNNSLLRPLEVQRAGRAAMKTEDMLRGFSVPKGTKLI